MTAQEEFDAKYVTSTELCQSLGVTRASVMNARNRGALPEPVRVNRPGGGVHLMIWDRDQARPYVDRWRAELEAGRGNI